MKKILSIVLALSLVFTLAACGGDDKKDGKGEKVNKYPGNYKNSRGIFYAIFFMCLSKYWAVKPVNKPAAKPDRIKTGR